MSSIGRDLQLTLKAAHREAVVRRHAYLTVEHLLYALIHSEDGAQILLHSGADVDRLRIELERFIEWASGSLKSATIRSPISTSSFSAFVVWSTADCRTRWKASVCIVSTGSSPGTASRSSSKKRS